MRSIILSIIAGVCFIGLCTWIMWDPGLTSVCWGGLGIYFSWELLHSQTRRITNPMYRPGDIVYVRTNPNQDVTTLLAEAKILSTRKGDWS